MRGARRSRGTARATLLPQVWEQCPEPWQFMDALKRKAGLPPSLPDAELQLWRYTVEKHVDPAPRAP